MSLLLLLPIVLFALIAMLLLCGPEADGRYVCTFVLSVCLIGLHVLVVLVLCPCGTLVGVSLGRGEDLT